MVFTCENCKFGVPFTDYDFKNLNYKKWLK